MNITNVLSLFKSLNIRGKIIAAVSVVLLLGGFFASGYLVGYTKGKAIAQVAIANYEKKVAVLERRIAENQTKVNTVTVTESVDKVRIVKEKEYVYVNIAKETVPQQEKLSKGWIAAHDAAASQSDISKEEASNPEKSDVYDNQALETTVVNYSTYYEVKARLDALQKWVRCTRENVETQKIDKCLAEGENDE